MEDTTIKGYINSIERLIKNVIYCKAVFGRCLFFGCIIHWTPN